MKKGKPSLPTTLAILGVSKTPTLWYKQNAVLFWSLKPFVAWGHPWASSTEASSQRSSCRYHSLETGVQQEVVGAQWPAQLSPTWHGLGLIKGRGAALKGHRLHLGHVWDTPHRLQKCVHSIEAQEQHRRELCVTKIWELRLIWLSVYPQAPGGAGGGLLGTMGLQKYLI